MSSARDEGNFDNVADVAVIALFATIVIINASTLGMNRCHGDRLIAHWRLTTRPRRLNASYRRLRQLR